MNPKPLTKKEEQAILASFKSGEFTSVRKKEKEMARYTSAARNTSKKTRKISIRMSEKDLVMIKTMAHKRGMPYQTFVTSVLHQISSKE